MKGSKKLVNKYGKEIIIGLIVSILSAIILFIFKDLLLYRALYIFYFSSRIIYLTGLLLINTCLYFLNKKYCIVKKSIAIMILSLSVIALGSIILFFNKKISNKGYLNVLYLASTSQKNIENEFMDDVNIHFGKEYFIPLMRFDTIRIPRYIEINNFIEKYTTTKEDNYDLIIYIKCDNKSDKESCYFYNYMPRIGYIGITDDFMKKLKNNDIKSRTDFEINIIYDLIVEKLVNSEKFNPETHYFILKERYDFQKDFLGSIKNLFINSGDYDKEMNNIELSMNNKLINYFYGKDPKKALEHLLKNFDISPTIEVSNLVDYVNIYELARIEHMKDGLSSFYLSGDNNFINGAVVNHYDYNFIYNEPIAQIEVFLNNYPEFIPLIYSKYKNNPFILFTLGMVYSNLANIGIFKEQNFTKLQISYQRKAIEYLKQFSKTYIGYYYLPYKIEYLKLELDYALGADAFDTIEKMVSLYKKYDFSNKEKVILLDQKYKYLLENTIDPRANGMVQIAGECHQEYTGDNDIRNCILGTDIYKIIDKINKIINSNYQQDKASQKIMEFIKEYKKTYNL